MNDQSIDDGGGPWDRIWRGRASSQRRSLANVAIETARVASLIAEGARLVDHLPSQDRTVEILGVCNELAALGELVKVTELHLRSEAGNTGPATRRGFWARLFGG